MPSGPFRFRTCSRTNRRQGHRDSSATKGTPDGRAATRNCSPKGLRPRKLRNCALCGATDVVAACDGLPLAVRAAAARLVARPGWDLATLADRLGDPHRRLDELSTGDLDVRASIRGGYDRLDPAGRTALRRLAAAADAELTAPRLAELWETSPDGVERIADRLVDARRLDDVGGHGGGHRYRIPDLVRIFAQEQPPP